MATSISDMSIITGSKNSYNCVIPILDTLITNVSNKNKKIRISTHNQFYSNNFTNSSNSSSYANYFGTGVDGDLTISSSAQVSASFNNTLDGDFLVKNFKNLTINSGILTTPLKRCRGLIIYCTGNLTVAGTLSMTGKGGGVGNKIATPLGGASTTEARYDLVDSSLYFNNMSSSANNAFGTVGHWNWAPSGSIWFNNYKIKITLSGSVGGGASKTGAGTGNSGTAGIFCCGGGGGGASNSASPTEAGQAGGRGTIFTGGAGGGGGSYAGPGPTISVAGTFEIGGRGGVSFLNTYGGGGGGAGSPAGAGGGPGGASAGTEGVGGLLILIVKGNISITGTVSNNGTTGGTGGVNNGLGGGGGGGSGGGRTIMLYGGTYTNSGTVVASGGTGGAGGSPGGSTGGTGGAGVITIRKVHV